MSFEIKAKNLLSRIGKLKTKSGTIETPLLFPVIHPTIQLISPQRIRKNFGFTAVIANAYVLKKRFNVAPKEEGIHNFLNFSGVIMTDSGAYQLLVYGDIAVLPEEIIAYQEQINTDIATILDWPTGWNVSKIDAEQTVHVTIKNARDLFKRKTRDDILWVGPIQGGKYLDLIVNSSLKMGKLPFQIFAVGSPTEVMEAYRFDVLVDMILSAKLHLPIEKPLHLFGAGHPFMFSLAVALGCDLFDSAAYAIYAKAGRYMTTSGTLRFERLDYFPCSCPRCIQTTPKEVREMPLKEQQVFLAEHNLYVSCSELKRIKQSIKEGTLWEHLKLRAQSHPALLTAVKKLKTYEAFLERHDPSVKNKGLFFYDSLDLIRPSVVRYRVRFRERYVPAMKPSTLLLFPQTRMKPFHRSKEAKKFVESLQTKLGDAFLQIHICFYAAPFGIIPWELDEVYPLAQHETVSPLDNETMDYVAHQVVNYIDRMNYTTVILLYDYENWSNRLPELCKKICIQKKLGFACLFFNLDDVKFVFPDLMNLLNGTFTK
jgi:7-cyano-7-deazaguanine tRNA-ribosyltransferase